jgi:transposase
VSGKLYWAISDHKDNALFRSVLSQVPEPSDAVKGRKTYVVIDTYRIHFANPVLALLAAHSDQIELVTLPTYSPQLNPVERFAARICDARSLTMPFSRPSIGCLTRSLDFSRTWRLALTSFARWRA